MDVTGFGLRILIVDLACGGDAVVTGFVEGMGKNVDRFDGLIVNGPSPTGFVVRWFEGEIEGGFAGVSAEGEGCEKDVGEAIGSFVVGEAGWSIDDVEGFGIDSGDEDVIVCLEVIVFVVARGESDEVLIRREHREVRIVLLRGHTGVIAFEDG